MSTLAPTISPELHARLREAIDAQMEDHIDLLLNLVAAESVTGYEAPSQAVLQRAYEARGLEIDRWEATPEEMEPHMLHIGEQETWTDRPNLAALRRGAGGGQSLLLQGHCDTVSKGDPTLWTRNPAGERDEERVYGRGAVDMKGGLVTHLGALDALDSVGIKLAGDVTLASTVGEENGGLGAMSLIQRGYRADAALISEPTRLETVTAQGGSLVFRLTITGKAAHGAVRNEGVSALEKFIPIFEDLMAWEAERNETISHPLYDELENKFPISIGVVRSHPGSWASTVPEELVAEGRLGFLPGESIPDMQRGAEQRIAAMAEEDPWLREHPPQVKWFGGQFDSAEIPADSPLAQAVQAAHQRAHGTESPIVGVTYGADMRLFTAIADMPTLMYGAGDVRHAHSADEYIEIAQIRDAIETMALTMIDWCGVATTD